MSDGLGRCENLWFTVKLLLRKQALLAGIDSGFGFKHRFLTLSGEKVTC